MVVANTGWLGVDVGGTFTDVVHWRDGVIDVVKVPTTPEDQSIGVATGALAAVGPDSGARLIHGTTVATNALLEHAGARTALITDVGFEDVVEIGRQDRPSLYDSTATRPAPLAPRDLRFGVAEGAPGDDLVDRLSALDVEAVAVCLLYSYVDPRNERAIAHALTAALPQLDISLSSEVAPEFREYERSSTTLINAYLQPVVRSYLERLVDRMDAIGLAETVAVMLSSGGLLDARAAARLPASILLSGPAGGVVATAALSAVLGLDNVISFDMGGTSTDVCRIENTVPVVRYERPVAGHPCRMPAVAIHTVGAGGGSIAWLDTGGALRVGPQSAGAIPGPASYGRGGALPTVSDANAVLGRLGETLAGGLVLDVEAARIAMRSLQLNETPHQTALGILTIVEERMADAVRTVSVAEGADPRSAHLVAFGGAGGLHATAVARQLEMAGVVVPPHAGVFSALGLLLSAPTIDVVHSLSRNGRVDDLAARLVDQAAERFRQTTGGQPTRVEVAVDVRYVGQSHETTVPHQIGSDAHVPAFHAEHRRRNGFSNPDDPVEVVTVRARATSAPNLLWNDLPPPHPSGPSELGTRLVGTADGTTEAAVWNRSALGPEAEIVGPAVVESADSTTWIGPGERCVVHESGALIVEW